MKQHWTRVVATLAVCLLAAISFAHAHPGIFASALVKIEPEGRVVVTLRHDAVAFALDTPSMKIADEPMNALVGGPDADLVAAFDDARSRYEAFFSVEADGRPVPFRITVAPTAADVRAWQRGQQKPVLPVRLDFVTECQLSADAKSLAVRFPETMGDVIITIDRPEQEPVALPLRNGELSPTFEVSVITPALAVGEPSKTDLLQAPPTLATQEMGGPTGPPAGLDAHGARPPADSISALDVAVRYLQQGFLHIVPDGLDHILFVLGLYLLSPTVRALLIQVTAFTLAHTVTLALTILGYISIPGSVIEPIIAASIAFVAIENLFTSKVQPWRPALVFGFGLIHGIGWAGALAELGLPEDQLASALISFNVGVELGQLTVVAGALLLVGWFRKNPWYRARITIPASLAIAAIALYWTFDRIFR